MARKMKKAPRVSTTAVQGAALGSLGDLLRGAGLRDEGTDAEPPPPESQASAERGRLLLRRERKGRGGKTVTLVSGLTLAPEETRALCRRLRKGLGCGASVEGQLLVLQGDQREAAAQLLQREGWQVRLG